MISVSPQNRNDIRIYAQQQRKLVMGLLLSLWGVRHPEQFSFSSGISNSKSILILLSHTILPFLDNTPSSLSSFSLAPIKDGINNKDLTFINRVTLTLKQTNSQDKRSHCFCDYSHDETKTSP